MVYIYTMTDRELARRLMFEYEWTQSDLADQLGVTQPIISRVLNKKQEFSRPVRMLAEMLLGQVDEQDDLDAEYEDDNEDEHEDDDEYY